MFGMHASSAYAQFLAGLSPKQRTEYLARQQARREEERLEATPEVQLAREYIVTDGLVGEHATRLLEFARDLARRREF